MNNDSDSLGYAEAARNVAAKLRGRLQAAVAPDPLEARTLLAILDDRAGEAARLLGAMKRRNALGLVLIQRRTATPGDLATEPE